MQMHSYYKYISGGKNEDSQETISESVSSQPMELSLAVLNQCYILHIFDHDMHINLMPCKLKLFLLLLL